MLFFYRRGKYVKQATNKVSTGHGKGAAVKKNLVHNAWVGFSQQTKIKLKYRARTSFQLNIRDCVA